MTKICSECKHHNRDMYGDYCHRRARTHIVTGQPVYDLCWAMRQHSDWDGYCGVEGKFWEPKEKHAIIRFFDKLRGK